VTPEHGRALRDPSGRLEGSGRGRRLQVAGASEADAALIRQLVKAAVLHGLQR
jgi:hypothetical protein